MLRWILWILIILWLLSKWRFLFKADSRQKPSEQNPPANPFTETKHLKNDAGDYVDYEELN